MDYNKNCEVDYNDEQHRYSMGEHRYTSASQLAEKFSNPFDTVPIAIKYAKKHGQTPEYWIAKWAEKNNKSKVRGNIIHDANETTAHGRMIETFNGAKMYVQAERTHVIPWIERPDGIYTEAKLWHHGYKIAGRADKIILTTETETGTDIRRAHIEDYKTNEKLDFKSYQFKNGDYKMMRPPIAHLQDCNWIHYCLQLSTYMLMLEYQGFEPGTMTITHYPHPSADDPYPLKKKYDVPYMKKEVLAMCNFINK